MTIAKLPRRNADSAASEAAGLVWGHLARQVAGPTATASNLARALAPVYGETLNRAVITFDSVGGAIRINHVFFPLRNSPLVRSEYDRLVAFLLEAYSYSAWCPPVMSEWRELAHRHLLEMHCPWTQILDVSLQLVSDGSPLPSNLADVNLAELHAVALASPFPVVFRRCGLLIARLSLPFPLPVCTSSPPSRAFHQGRPHTGESPALGPVRRVRKDRCARQEEAPRAPFLF